MVKGNSAASSRRGSVFGIGPLVVVVELAWLGQGPFWDKALQAGGKVRVASLTREPAGQSCSVLSFLGRAHAWAGQTDDLPGCPRDRSAGEGSLTRKAVGVGAGRAYGWLCAGGRAVILLKAAGQSTRLRGTPERVSVGILLCRHRCWCAWVTALLRIRYANA